MTNDDRPAAAGGGPVPTPDPDRLAADLPVKLRVHALAKLLGLSSKDVLAALTEIGSPARGAQSSIDRDTALRVAAALLPDPAEPGGGTAEDIEDGGLVAPLAPIFAPPQPLFLAPGKPRRSPPPVSDRLDADIDDDEDEDEDASGDAGAEVAEDSEDDADSATGRRRRRRGRRGRGRGKAGQNGDDEDTDDEDAEADEAADGEDAADGGDEGEDDEDADDTAATRRRRRRRRRKSADVESAAAGEPREDDPPNTVVHVREVRRAAAAGDDDGVQGVKGSTRLEAKRQRRRDGREAGRRRPPILSEAEFLARREAVDRIMVVREHGRSGNGGGHGDQGLVQIGVLEDGVLVEHFVTSAGTGSLVGNVYLGRVQNVLPSMEAAFVDVGRGRNAVLYAGEVDWDAAGLEGKARKIEQALSSGDSVLVQVTKDPVGHKGARLTTQISLPGRFLVYVPGGGATGISRKLPDTERRRLKDILRRIVPEDAGVIIRTASEGVPEEALGRDVRRLQAQWDVIRTKSGAPKAQAPQLLYAEPDLLIKVVRDLFTEDFSTLVVQGRDAMDTIEAYVEHVAPDLRERLRKHVGTTDVFTEYRIDEQLLKALDRKVWLPSGGYLVIDRTEAMTVIDVNTGKFTGSGGNLEETVTRNNLEAAEEIVRQLRLRDIGGIIVIDFIDMVLESNRDLVLRRLTECLGRDRTRHQVAEVTSLGLVQMTRKRVGGGLLEAFSAPCEQCRGRGVLVSTEPVEAKAAGGDARADLGSGRRARGRGKADADRAPAAPEPPRQRVKAEVAAAVAAPAGTTDGRATAGAAEPAAAAQQGKGGAGPDPTVTGPAGSDAGVAGAAGGALTGGVAEDGFAGPGETAAPEAPEAAATPEAERPEPPRRSRARRSRSAAKADAETDAGAPPVVKEPSQASAAPETATRRRRAASRPAGPPAGGDVSQAG